MKLALGTVQFGLSYGATNTTGKVAQDAVSSILAFAEAAGIELLDTAAAYGDSESVLGRCLAAPSRFRIVSKTLPLRAMQTPDVAQVIARVQASLAMLRQPCLHAVLVHHAGDLLSEQGPALFSGLQQLQEARLIERVGVSVYTPDELEAVLARFPVSLVQLPLNVLDQSFVKSSHLVRLHEQGIEIHTRSTFLQGLLLQGQLPPALRELAPGMQALQRLSQQHECDALTLCLRFVQQQSQVDQVLVGVTTRMELEQINAAWIRAANLGPVDFTDCNMAPNRLLNPANWPVTSE